MRSVRVKLVLLLGSAILLLSGCAKMDAAAIIGDVEIPISTVQTSIEDVMKERGEVDTSGMELPIEDFLARSQIQFHISTAILDELAKQFGIEVTQTAIDAEYQFIIEQIGGEDALPEALAGANIARSDLESYIVASKIYERLGEALVAQGIQEEEISEALQALLVEKARELTVTLNPRYGVWDEATATVKAGGDSNGAVTDDN
jgi:FKBP-type peptidyl-prolyl cis-trans isomerase (trigger factor)